MKKVRKLASFLLALVMVMGLSVTTLAATSTVTVNNKTDHTYVAYQIFGGTYDSTSGALSDITWGSGINCSGFLSELTSSTTSVTVTENSQSVTKTLSAIFAGCTTAESVAEKLTAYNSSTSLANAFAALADAYVVSAYAVTMNASGATSMDEGYYLIVDTSDATSSTYVNLSLLQIVGTSITIEAKNGAPANDKDVNGADYTSAGIGETLTFTLTVDLSSVTNISEYEKYALTFTDKLSEGLTFIGISSVVAYNSSDTAVATFEKVDTAQAGAYYTATLPSSGSYGGNLTVSISDITEITNWTSIETVVVTYTAKLNERAVVGNSGNLNEYTVEYSNNPNSDGDGDTGTTPTDKVVVFTFELDGTKVIKGGMTAVSGAKFRLYKVDGSTTYYAVLDSDGKLSSWTTFESDATVVTSDTSGNFTFSGLGEGTYYLEETEAPSGYNSLSGPIEIEITAEYELNNSTGEQEVTELKATLNVPSGDSASAAAGDPDDGTIDIKVENAAGSSLPTTGGMGTTAFYIIGSLLVFGAAVVLITRKRMSAE